MFKVKGMCLGSGLQNKLIVSLILYSEKKLTYKWSHISQRSAISLDMVFQTIQGKNGIQSFRHCQRMMTFTSPVRII